MYNNRKIRGQKNLPPLEVIKIKKPNQAGLLINIYKLATKKAAKRIEIIVTRTRELVLKSFTLLVMVLIRFRFLKG
jgi:hypothetical protein